MPDLTEWARWYASKSPIKAATYARRYRDSDDPFMNERAHALLRALRVADRCEDCGRTLQDPVSVARGVGPDCWADRQKATA